MNIKNFFRAPQKVTTKKPSNPCEYGRAVWDDMNGNYEIQNYNLRKISMCLGIAVVVLTGGIVFQSLKSTVEPYIIEVDSTTGAVKNAGVITDNKYTPQDIEIEHFIGEFIKDTRTMPLDPVVYKNNWSNAYSFLTKSAGAKMTSQVKMDKLSDDFGKKTVQVSIISILPVDGSNSSYQARWTEEVFMVNSGEKKTIPMSGTFTITRLETKDKKALLINPLGLYLTDFNWVQDTTTTQSNKTNTNTNSNNSSAEKNTNQSVQQ